MMTPKILKKVGSLSMIPFLAALGLSSYAVALPKKATPDSSEKDRAGKYREVEIRTDFGFSKEPLTTEKIGELDPKQKNPHLQRWVLDRKIELVGLAGFHRPDKKWGVRLKGIDSLNLGYLRDPGNAYSHLRNFSCAATPDEWFHTVEGAKQSLQRANELWIAFLKENEVKLGWLLNHVATDSVDLALKRGQQNFEVWYDEADLKWRGAFTSEIRAAEWKFYHEQAEAEGICKKGRKLRLDSQPATDQAADQPNDLSVGQSVSQSANQSATLSTEQSANLSSGKSAEPFFRSFMEPVSDEPPLSITKILARAPARLWDGLFSVRIEVGINGKKLNGRFLIDSSANVSLISPSWLESQGIYPEWIQIPNIALKRVVWNRLGNEGPGFTKRVFVNTVTMSGFQLPIHEFGLIDTEIFSPPASLGTCCDGLIGNDFLNQFPVEFQAESPAEVRVWPKRDFHFSPETPWVQISSGANGELVSQCDVEPSTGGNPVLKGVRWDSGSQEGLIIHSPWQKELGKNKNVLWNISCDGEIPLAQSMPMSSPQSSHSLSLGGAGSHSISIASGPAELASFSAKYPAVNLGGPLMSRGNYTLDLPHGRMWLSEKGLKKVMKKPSPSGLELAYVFKNGQRVLQVKSIRGDFSTKLLAEAGLKKGTIVTGVDHRPADEMDQWEVNRHLSGEYGDMVSIEWNYLDQRKLAPLRHPSH